jgi:hypothetical protein
MSGEIRGWEIRAETHLSEECVDGPWDLATRDEDRRLVPVIFDGIANDVVDPTRLDTLLVRAGEVGGEREFLYGCRRASKMLQITTLPH